MAAFPIKDSVVLVTGATRARGIGRAIVEAFLAAGARKVYATARSTDQLRDLAARHRERVVPLALDVTDGAAIAALPKQAPDVTVVVNNAGTFSTTLALSGDEAGARREMEVNYFAPLRVVRALAPVLRRNGGGAVVNIASIASLVNFPVAPTYSASKAAAHSLTQAQRRELGRQGTRVIGVYPGPIDTDMADGIELPKTPPGAVGDAVIAALRGGTEDVFPDPMSVELSRGVQADAKAVERQIAASAP
jgi:NAD(P)-dependent dehydrogenase (short-subunit alcohol dehydrogenase family)